MSLVVVLLGTDHHPFDRLVAWADEAVRRHPDVTVWVQHGASRAPGAAQGKAFLPHDELLDLLARASVVVCHGGPGTIMDARGAGHVPLCVPRDPALGEHVDGHQMRFADLVDRAGVVRRVGDAEEFHGALDVLLASTPPEPVSLAPVGTATEEARARLARELDQVLVPRARAPRWGRGSRMPGGRR